MHINTKSYETMMNSLCDVLNVDSKNMDELLQTCYNKFEAKHAYLDMDEQYEFFTSFVKEHIQHPIDSVSFYHLSRRLCNDNDCTGYSLVDVVTKDTSLSKYISNYGLSFTYDKQLKMYINEKEIDLSNNQYFAERFGYSYHDFSIGGYAFRDQIEQSDYYDIAIGGPEFFGYLFEYDVDDDAIIDDFIKHSQYYLFTYVVPLQDIEFVSYEELDEQEKMLHMIVITLQRLYFAKYDLMYNYQENQVLKMKNNKNIDAMYLVNKSIL